MPFMPSRLRGDHRQPDHPIKNNRPVEMTVSEVLRETRRKLVETLKRELELRQFQVAEELHYRPWSAFSSRNGSTKKIEQCKRRKRARRCFRGLQPFRKQLVRENQQRRCRAVASSRIRRISLFDINQHHEEMEK